MKGNVLWDEEFKKHKQVEKRVVSTLGGAFWDQEKVISESSQANLKTKYKVCNGGIEESDSLTSIIQHI